MPAVTRGAVAAAEYNTGGCVAAIFDPTDAHVCSWDLDIYEAEFYPDSVSLHDPEFLPCDGRFFELACAYTLTDFAATQQVSVTGKLPCEPIESGLCVDPSSLGFTAKRALFQQSFGNRTVDRFVRPCNPAASMAPAAAVGIEQAIVAVVANDFRIAPFTVGVELAVFLPGNQFPCCCCTDELSIVVREPVLSNDIIARKRLYVLSLHSAPKANMTREANWLWPTDEGQFLPVLRATFAELLPLLDAHVTQGSVVHDTSVAFGLCAFQHPVACNLSKASRRRIQKELDAFAALLCDDEFNAEMREIFGWGGLRTSIIQEDYPITADFEGTITVGVYDAPANFHFDVYADCQCVRDMLHGFCVAARTFIASKNIRHATSVSP
jgi:hypothetical protein